jgi:ElaB/YqjD/DUF883 family membrane-anchored ribosome-binding protein
VDNELEVIRHQMEQKRASLADKIDLLQDEALKIVHETTDQVANIVDEVKTTVETVVDDVKSTATSVTEGVEKTVETVKETLNVSDHIRRRPWLALGGAFAVGVVGGYLTGTPSRRWSDWSAGQGWTEPSVSTAAPPEAPPSRFEAPPEPARYREPESSESTWSVLGEAGKEAVGKLKEVAIGTLMGVLGQVVLNALPDALRSDASNIMRDLTTKLGGRTVDVSEWLNQMGGSEQDRTSQQHAETSRGGNGRDW